MGATYVTDLRHFHDGFLDCSVEVPGPARRLGEYLGRITETATVRPPGQLIETPVPCRRRPKRRPCPGHIRLQRSETPPQIEWRCTACDENGFIRGWEGTLWDLSEAPATETEVVVVLDPQAYGAIVRDPYEYESIAVIRRACHTHDGIVLAGSVDELTALRNELAEAANGEKSRRRQRLLDAAFEALSRALGRTL